MNAGMWGGIGLVMLGCGGGATPAPDAGALPPAADAADGPQPDGGDMACPWTASSVQGTSDNCLGGQPVPGFEGCGYFYTCYLDAMLTIAPGLAPVGINGCSLFSNNEAQRIFCTEQACTRYSSTDIQCDPTKYPGAPGGVAHMCEHAPVPSGCTRIRNTPLVCCP